MGALHPRCVIRSSLTTWVTHPPLCACMRKCVCALSSSLCCLPLVGHDTDCGTTLVNISIFSHLCQPDWKLVARVSPTSSELHNVQCFDWVEVKWVGGKLKRASVCLSSDKKSDSFFFFSQRARFRTRPPHAGRSFELYHHVLAQRSTAEKTCKQSTIIICTLKRDMINAIPCLSENARKGSFFVFWGGTREQSRWACPIKIHCNGCAIEDFYPICWLDQVTVMACCVFGAVNCCRVSVALSRWWPLCILADR